MLRSNLTPNRLFAAICVVSVVTLAGYIYWAKMRGNPTPATGVGGAAPAVAAREPAPGTVHNKPQQIFFRYTGVDSNYGKLAFVDTGHVEQIRFVDGLTCEVSYVAGGRGICLTAARGVFTTYSAKLFDAKTFEVSAQFPLPGVPSRARVSADGRIAAFTVFVSGHSYASTNFSTQTVLVDVAGARVLANVEDFSVFRDGRPLRDKDFNFWGVTFTPDAKQFYSTLSTKGQHLLVKGDIAQRSATVIHENVECPSLSPDGRRIAYKKRFSVNNRIVWRLHVLDLTSRVETPLSEERSVDDQLEWLDDHQLLYTAPDSEPGNAASTHVWRMAADGSSAPELFLRKAFSPSAIRSL